VEVVGHDHHGIEVDLVLWNVGRAPSPANAGSLNRP